MKYSYYPGCTLKTKAKDLDEYARKSAKVLGFDLEEVENWQCCGGVYPLGTDEIATKLSSVRTLNAAKEKGQELVTICSACHHVIKRVNDDMKNVEDIQIKANNYMKLEEPYKGETTVLHYLEVLRDRIGFDKLKEKVVCPFEGILFHRAFSRGVRCEKIKRGGVKMERTISGRDAAERIKEISGTNPLKCMKCGKCSATCPSFNEMDIKPHQFVSYVVNEDIEALVNSKSLWKCLSCFACVERCPRDVKPGKIIDAARQLVVRKKGGAYLSPDEIPELLDPELPQQLLVSAFRRYRR